MKPPPDIEEDPFYPAARARKLAMSQRLVAEVPAMAAIAENGSGPVVIFTCPKCGRDVVEVECAVYPNRPAGTVDFTLFTPNHAMNPDNDRMDLEGTTWFGDPFHTEDGNDWETDGPLGLRPRFTCPKQRCGFSGVYRIDRVLGLYAYAVGLGIPEVPLEV